MRATVLPLISVHEFSVPDCEAIWRIVRNNAFARFGF